MPSEFGLPLLHIAQHSNAYKAEDWVNWTCLYSIPLLKQFHDKSFVDNWFIFVEAAQIATKKSITNEQLHNLDCIKNCGPCWVYWQYPIERLCGMLQPMQFYSRQVVWIKDGKEEL
ncbi:44661_t:CDS:2 [Gigaspora margarita]|uniref:44661_t:CDS:1 n=1 Tax=Gigaspora margarita TaxID=4874 RepID=A0ABN7UUY3_GIGMA|nr:44661_t:CDS:2 [Gigaspora margarita]